METTSKASKADRRFIAFFAASVTLAMATLLNASTSTQVKPLNPLVVPRTAHAATALNDGRVLITGGRDSAGNIVAVSEIFDPATETSTAGATLTTPRVDHTATLLPNGRVLVAGGTGASGSLTSAEIFDPSNPSAGFRVLPAPIGTARSRHTATVLNDGKVLIAGGDAVGTAEIFDPATETFSSALLNMAASRIGHTATLFSDDSVLFAGGNTNSMELFTAANQTFTLDSQTMSAARNGHWALELNNTRLLLFGGDTGNTIEEFNPSTDTLTLSGTMAAAASSATLLANGKILVLGANMAGLYAPDATPPFTAFDETSVPDSTALKRSGQTATELSGDKKIFVAGGKNAQNLFQGAALFNPARISTDKDDYAPDEPVILSGSGWKASEGVQLYAVDNATEQWTYGSTVPANANGEFVVSPFFIVELRHAGVQFHVTALGAQSAMQADVKFTDSVGSVTITTVNGTPKANFGPPTNFQITYTSLPQSVTVAFSYSTSASGTTTGTLDLVGTAVTASKSLTTGVGPLSDSITINIPPGTPNGTYNLRVTVTNNAGSGANQKNDQVSQAIVINANASTTLTVSPASGTYGGTVNLSATLTKTSDSSPVSGKSISFTLNGSSVGSATTNGSGVATLSGVSLCGINVAGSPYPSGVGASFAADSDFAGSNGTASLTVNKATATVVVTPYNTTYNCSPHTATVTSITGVCGETGATVGTVDVSNTTHTNAGTYSSDTWSFTGTANYNNIAATTITDVIGKANATINITPYTSATTTYNCSAHTATGTATGCEGNLSALLDLTGTTHTNAGDYPSDGWTFNAGNTNPNYNSASGTVHDSIAKANATINVTPYNVSYNCNAHTAVGTATGCDGDLSSLLHLGGTTHTDAGDYPSDPWTFDGNANYNSASGTVHDVINKADTTSSVTSNVNPSTIGQNVTFTATVAGNPAVTCSPTGTVTFKDGATVLGTGTLNGSAQATFSTSSLSAGNHSITAVYSGDSNFNATGATAGSTAPIYVQAVHYDFIGFFQPIDNLPTFNSVKAGQVIPIKWQLKDINGTIICDLSTLAPSNGLTWVQIACVGGAPIDSVEELAAPGSTMFRCDGTQFIYNWQTSKSWAGKCVLMTVKLADGTTHSAQFTFK